MFGLEIAGDRDVSSRHAIADDWLARLGLENFGDAYPSQLSGGLSQRVSISRAFAIAPELLIGDETFSALDEITAGDVRKDLLRLVHETGRTTIFVTHSINEAVDLAERVIVFGRPAHVIGEVNVKDRIAAGDKRSAVAEQIRELLIEAHQKAKFDQAP